MKYKEVMTHILMPSWMKYHDEKDSRIVRKVYSIGDLRYANESEFFSSGMSTPTLEKIKRRLPSSSNLTMNNNNTILTSTLGKLLVRKLTHRSTTNMTKSTNDLNSNAEREDSTRISKDNLQFIEQIGEGKFSTVFKAFYRTKQNEVLTVAVRKCKQNGISIERDVKHPHIIQFYGTVMDTDQGILLVTEYASLKSLYHCLISPNSKREYSILVLLEFLKQIASAMSYLEKKSIIHKNLSCQNYLVFTKSLIKLSDWNTSSSSISPEVTHFQRHTTASDVFSFGVSMCECFNYGESPCTDQNGNAIDSFNHQQLSRPPYATSELYQIMLLCCKDEPSERPTFSQLEKQLNEIDLKQVRWKNQLDNQSLHIPDDFLPIESCLLGPLIILDRCLHIPKSSNIIQCVSIDGQIGFIDTDNVEPLHVISLSKSSLPMNSIFHRKAGIKKNSTKTKAKQLSKDMISAPQADLVHAFHVGMTGDTFGDITRFNQVESSEQKPKEEQPPSLLDEVMQAFTEICPENTSASLDTSSPLTHEHPPIGSSPSVPRFLPLDHVNEQEQHDANLLIHRRISNSSVSSSSHAEKSDYRSHYSSISSLNSRSSSINKPEVQPSITGQPLPPPPDLSSLGSKLTIATLAETFQLPKSLTLNKYRTKKRFHLFT